MYCLIQLYLVVSEDLKPYRPLLKLFAIKAVGASPNLWISTTVTDIRVVFLTFWQATFLSVLAMAGVVKDVSPFICHEYNSKELQTKHMTAADINIGFNALLECFEMMIFGFLHIRAFSYKPYRPFHDPHSDEPPPERTPRFKSLGHALDFRETFRELWTGCVYFFHKARGKAPKADFSAHRISHFEGAFGQPRPSGIPPAPRRVASRVVEKEKPTSPRYTSVDQAEVNESPRWLDLSHRVNRETSESLEIQIEKELERRGYGSGKVITSLVAPTETV